MIQQMTALVQHVRINQRLPITLSPHRSQDKKQLHDKRTRLAYHAISSLELDIKENLRKRK
jgi:hypothetical protein